MSSPLRRTRETADVVAEELGLDVELEPGFAEVAFGEWDGFTFADIMERWPDDMRSTGSTRRRSRRRAARPSTPCCERVDEARKRLLTDYEGQTVVVVSHVTPIKMMVRLALDAPMERHPPHRAGARVDHDHPVVDRRMARGDGNFSAVPD